MRGCSSPAIHSLRLLSYRELAGFPLSPPGYVPQAFSSLGAASTTIRQLAPNPPDPTDGLSVERPPWIGRSSADNDGSRSGCQIFACRTRLHVQPFFFGSPYR